jgi:hypothetical protein
MNGRAFFAFLIDLFFFHRGSFWWEIFEVAQNDPIPKMHARTGLSVLCAICLVVQSGSFCSPSIYPQVSRLNSQHAFESSAWRHLWPPPSCLQPRTRIAEAHEEKGRSNSFRSQHSRSILFMDSSSKSARRGGPPRALTDEELEAAKRWITPEVQAQFTLKDGTVDYKVGDPTCVHCTSRIVALMDFEKKME